MTIFYEALLYDHPLTPESVIVDVGTHDGNSLGILVGKYNCFAHSYEPVPEFFNAAVRRFADNPKVKLWPFALGDANGLMPFGVKGDMSGAYCTSPNDFIGVPMRCFSEAMDNILTNGAALLQINCEGGEYAILEDATSTGIIRDFAFVQAQPHPVVPDYEARWNAICAAMEKTHEMVFDSPWCWVGWRRRP